MEGSQRNGAGHAALYMNQLKCSSCGSQSPQHSEVCSNTQGSHLGEEMTELHSEYSDSSCGKDTFAAPPLLPLKNDMGSCGAEAANFAVAVLRCHTPRVGVFESRPCQRLSLTGSKWSGIFGLSLRGRGWTRQRLLDSRIQQSPAYTRLRATVKLGKTASVS